MDKLEAAIKHYKLLIKDEEVQLEIMQDKIEELKYVLSLKELRQKLNKQSPE